MFRSRPSANRKGRRRDERRTQSLERPEPDERLVTPSEAAQKRTDGEDDRADDEHAPAPEQVGRAAAEEQEAPEDQRIGADDPLEVLLGEPEVVLDRRQRDVHDRDVQDDHELHREDERECEPFLAIRSDHVSPFSRFSSQTSGRWYNRHFHFAS